MKIDFVGTEFVASCKFEERLILPRLGFKWDPQRKKWVTKNPGVAVSIGEQYLTDRARVACGLNRDIPKPEGLDYLPFQEDGIKFALPRRRTLVADQPGLGKGHPPSTRLLTPKGWRALGDIKVGDKVIGWDGSPIMVTGVFPRGVQPIYEVLFDDGVSTLCDSEHLWTVCEDDADGGRLMTIDVLDLAARLDAGAYLTIPTLLDAAVMEPATFTVEPRAAGADLATWYGCDGKKKVAYPDSLGAVVEEYANGSAWQKMDFLYGVFGSIGRVRDGTIRLEFRKAPAVKGIERAITDCVRSLGGLVYREERFRRLRLTVHLPDNEHIWMGCIGKSHHTGKMYRRWRDLTPGVNGRRVTGVRPAGRDNSICISVNGLGNLYVVDGYVLTHNTIQGIGVGNAIHDLKNTLIIPPASLKKNWVKEWKKWTTHPHLSIDIAEGSKFPTSDVVVINYDILNKHRDALRQREWQFLLADEQHYLKNPDAGRTKEALGGVFKIKDPKSARVSKLRVDPIPAHRKVFLGGTPHTGKTSDLWGMIKECDPMGLGRDAEKFYRDFCGGYQDLTGFVKDGDVPDEKRQELNRYLKSKFMIRRLKMDVLKDLPAKVRQIVPLPQDGLKKAMEAEKKALTDLLDAYELMTGIRREMTPQELVGAMLSLKPETWEAYAKTVDGDAGSITMPLTRLANARQDLALAKLPMVLEYIENLLESGEKVVVFAYHQLVIEGIVEAFRKKNSFSTSCIYGKTPMGKRQQIADDFQSDPFNRLFVGQYTAAGVGYTLTEACHVVCAELTWVPHELLQAEDRCHRIGSEKWDTVWAHHLVVEGSLDDTFVVKLIEKMRIIELTLD